MVHAASDGSSLGYQSNESEPVSLTMTSEKIPGASYEYDLTKLTVSSSAPITLTNNITNTQLVVSNKAGSTSQTYDMGMHRITNQGETDFRHAQVKLGAGDTQYFSYGTWNSGDLTMQIDHNSDGSIDETVQLSNTKLMYLPMITR